MMRDIDEIKADIQRFATVLEYGGTPMESLQRELLLAEVAENAIEMHRRIQEGECDTDDLMNFVKDLRDKSIGEFF